MIKTRITEMLGVQYPIVQAPMGWIARSQLASAVSNAGRPYTAQEVAEHASEVFFPSAPEKTAASA